MNTDYLLTGNPNEIRFNCPICGDTKHHLYINKRKKKGICFRCNYTPTKEEVKEFLKYVSPVDDFYVEEKKDIKVEIEVPGISVEEDVYATKEILKMIGKEKIEIDDLVKVKAHISSDYPYIGVVLPIVVDNKVIGFTCRKVAGEPKYLHSKGVKTSKVLYNLKEKPVVVLVEGPFDAIWSDGVAVFGHFISREQMFLLFSSGVRKAILMFDADVHDKFLLQEAKKLSGMFDTYVAKLKKGDPYEHSKEELLEIIRDAMPYEEYIFNIRR